MSEQPTLPDRIVNPTPKTRFMASDQNVTKHRQLVDSREFERGVDFALMEYQTQLMGAVTDGNHAAAVALKLRGAHEFLQIFRMLGEQVRIPKVSPMQDHLPEPN